MRHHIPPLPPDKPKARRRNAALLIKLVPTCFNAQDQDSGNPKVAQLAPAVDHQDGAADTFDALRRAYRDLEAAGDNDGFMRMRFLQARRRWLATKERAP
jgi:hypothetical protein